jgi:5'-nucleotidase
MHILLTNDDGIFAPGLAAVCKQLKTLEDVEITVAAPADSQSGASHSITYKSPLTCNHIDVNNLFRGYSVQGSPADCVKLAYLQLTDKPIDLVISGMNNGLNTGINVYYSGTVAAAMEAGFLKIPSIALSLACDEPMDFKTASEYSLNIIKKLIPVIKGGDVFNVNIPKLSEGKPKGVRIVPQSTKGFHERYIPQQDEDGKTVFQLAGGPHNPDDEHTDTTSIAEGYITLSSLVCGMTNKKRTAQLQESGIFDESFVGEIS